MDPLGPNKEAPGEALPEVVGSINSGDLLGAEKSDSNKPYAASTKVPEVFADFPYVDGAGSSLESDTRARQGGLALDLSSARAKEARLGVRISKTAAQVAIAVAWLLVVVGCGGLVTGMSIGWLLIGLGAIPAMYGLWDSHYLNDMPPKRGGTRVDDVLESSILGALRGEVTPRTIAVSLAGSTSAQFVLTRIGLPQSVLVEFSSNEVNDAGPVWLKAQSIRVRTKQETLRGSMVVAALCETQPELREGLPHIQLDTDDVYSCVEWYERLTLLIDAEQKPKNTGGIARDWNFGYANLLEHFGHNLSQQISNGGLLHVRLDSHINILRQLQSVFSNDGRQNVALVGKLGVGKTAVVQAFTESLLDAKGALPRNLRFQQVIKLDAAALIRAAHNRSELEGLVQQLFIEAFQAKNIILFLDDAQMFFEEGNGSVDLAQTLMPILEGGRLRLLMAMDEQAYLRIAQRDPGLVAVMNRINVPAASEEETMLVMQDQIIRVEATQKVTFSYQSLKEAYRLSERYQQDLAQPGRAVRLLEQAARQSEQGYVSVNSVAAAVEQTSGVKVASASSSASERHTLLNLEDLIHQRMVNQSRAVAVVSDSLRRAKAGVRNEQRPIGTFLFLGPTGVGKTELAKALAAVYFGGEDHLVRVDLNEFVRAEDVARLIADGADDPHGLAASVRKQPFSVVLLDEIEKAHPQVLTTLLQMLDEGILRDINNREVSFRDAIVIGTSNAGAERIRELIGQGEALEQFEKQIVDELIDSQQFRPEFLNRFDEIVVFRPLTKQELGQVVEGMVRGINKTLKAQKIQVTLTPAAVARLADVGYDPRLGARPMRRVVQRNVENLLAKRILEGSARPGQTIQIDESDIVTTQP